MRAPRKARPPTTAATMARSGLVCLEGLPELSEREEPVDAAASCEVDDGVVDGESLAASWNLRNSQS